MKLYNCKVRLHGDVRDEVRRRDVTAGEIRVLQQIHGDDAVLEITPTGAEAMSLLPMKETDFRTEEEERDRLAHLYGEAATAKLFGAAPVAVGAELEGVQPTTILRRKKDTAAELVG